MSTAKLIVTPDGFTMRTGTAQAFNSSLSGLLATINDAEPTWQNLVGCAIDPADNSVYDNASGSGWGLAGVTSAQTIAAGDGFMNFVAAVPPANPSTNYPEFGGRQFFAGLTSKATVNTFTDIDFGVQVFQGGVGIYESGALRRVVGAPRNNGVYQVGIESGVVVWRVDGAIVYRSGQPITYPVRFGTAFLNHGFDRIGGVTTRALPFTYSAVNAATGAAAGTFFFNTWTAPTTPGRYKITSRQSNNLFGIAYVNVQALFPWPNSAAGWGYASEFLELPPQYKVNKQEFDDLAADYNVPYTEGMRTWRITFNLLSSARAKILDDFYEAHLGEGKAFYFFDYRKNTIFDNCRITKYDAAHKKVWNRQRTIEITRRPL